MWEQPLIARERCNVINDLQLDPMFASDWLYFEHAPVSSPNAIASRSLLACIGDADKQQLLQHAVGCKQVQQMRLVEIRGTLAANWTVELLPSTYFWLCFQLVGISQCQGVLHSRLSSRQYRGFYRGDQRTTIEIEKGRVSMIFVGLALPELKAFAAEWPMLAVRRGHAEGSDFAPITMGYRIQKCLEGLQKCPDTPFSLFGALHFHYCQLLGLYHRDLEDKARSLHKEDVILYKEVIDYIYQHYDDAAININSIAQHFHVSARKLYRIFQDKHTSVHRAIQLVRLYSAKDLLRKSDATIDGIAFTLHFSTAHYFNKLFVQEFGHSPSRERELYRKRKRKRKSK